MLNTTYNELLELCVENNITTTRELAEFFNYPAQDILTTIAALNKDKDTPLFTKVKQNIFAESDWFDDDYEFYPDEQVAAIDDYNFVTDHGVALSKVTITKFGKSFCKFRERAIQYELGYPVIEVRKKYRLATLVAKHFIPKPEGCEHYTSAKVIGDNDLDCFHKNIIWYQ